MNALCAVHCLAVPVLTVLLPVLCAICARSGRLRKDPDG